MELAEKTDVTELMLPRHSTQVNLGLFLRPAQRALRRPNKACLLSEVADLQNEIY